jgi:hypothetical protein
MTWTFLAAETVLHYEFMQDYKVHIKHTGERWQAGTPHLKPSPQGVHHP